MKKIITYCAVALLLLGLFGWWYYQPERVLERRLDNLIETLNFDTSTTRTSRVMKSTSIGKFFDQQVELASPIEQANGNFSPDDFQQGLSFLSENAREIVIKRDSTLQTQVEGDHATQEFEADVNVAINRWINGLDGRYQITIHWRKTEEGWKIHSSTWQGR